MDSDDDMMVLLLAATADGDRATQADIALGPTNSARNVCLHQLFRNETRARIGTTQSKRAPHAINSRKRTRVLVSLAGNVVGAKGWGCFEIPNASTKLGYKRIQFAAVCDKRD